MMRLLTVVFAALVVVIGTGQVDAVPITFLDFEDGQLPSAHGWTAFGSGSSSIVQDETNNGTSLVLRMSGSSKFGWLFDLDPLGIPQDHPWMFTADLRQTNNDVTLQVDSDYAQAFSSSATLALRDGQWHNLKMDMTSGGEEFKAYLDGEEITPYTPNFGTDPAYRHSNSTSAYSIAVYWGNIGQSGTFYADNIVFDDTLPSPQIPERCTLIIWSVLGALGTGVGWWRSVPLLRRSSAAGRSAALLAVRGWHAVTSRERRVGMSCQERIRMTQPTVGPETCRPAAAPRDGMPPCRRPRAFLSSSGLGTMGFGLPAAVGAKVAHPDKLVIDIDGDGSLTMNIQELATCYCEKIPVKVMLLNNQHLGMVVQWEDRFCAANRAHTYLGPIDHPEAIGRGNGIGPEQRYPDFVTIAKGFGWPAPSWSTP